MLDGQSKQSWLFEETSFHSDSSHLRGAQKREVEILMVISANAAVMEKNDKQGQP